MTVPASYVAMGHGKSTLPLFSTSTYNPGPAVALSRPAQEPSAGPRGKLNFPLVLQGILTTPQGPFGDPGPSHPRSQGPPYVVGTRLKGSRGSLSTLGPRTVRIRGPRLGNP